MRSGEKAETLSARPFDGKESCENVEPRMALPERNFGLARTDRLGKEYPMIPTIEAPELSPLFAGADHVDVKTVEADVTLREFVSGAMGWQPGWMKVLFRVRTVLARMLRLRDSDIPAGPRLRPDNIPFVPGGKVWFFTVAEAAEDRYIALEVADTHLAAYCVIMAEPVATGRNRFHVATVVKYQRWTGPLYFNVIRPFHHVVVRSMVNAGARVQRAEGPFIESLLVRRRTL